MKKSAGIIIRNKKLLVLRTSGKTTFYAPGGKPDLGESPIEALCRELKEEIDIDVCKDSVYFFNSYSAPAADNETVTLDMDVFFVPHYEGKICASREIEELAWVDTVDIEEMSISSIFRDSVVPKLKEMKLID